MFEWRVFATGSEGNGPVGGAIEGREGRGSVVPDILNCLQRLCGRWVAMKVLGTRCPPEQPFFFVRHCTAGTMSVARLHFSRRARQKLKW